MTTLTNSPTEAAQIIGGTTLIDMIKSKHRLHQESVDYRSAVEIKRDAAEITKRYLASGLAVPIDPFGQIKYLEYDCAEKSDYTSVCAFYPLDLKVITPTSLIRMIDVIESRKTSARKHKKGLGCHKITTPEFKKNGTKDSD
jgi:hypothetical protein